MRQFALSWFKGLHSTWLEYSVEKDAAYSLCCYLFKNEFVHETTGDFYASKIFRGWNKALERFCLRVCKVNSVHHKCYNTMLDLSNLCQSIQVVLDKHSQKAKSEHRIRLEASIDVARLLLYHGLPFRGHDESEASTNQGYFLGLFWWHEDKHPDVEKVILKQAPQNHTLTCLMIQKDIANACVKETLKVIIEDLNGDYFGILVDESKDISHKEQMALVLRYVDKNGDVVERFIGLVYVSDTSACSLKKETYSLLSDHSLNPSKICGQGYDGASNMKGEIYGLKTLIMKDRPSTYYIHCLAHQLQLTLVAIAKKYLEVEDVFDHVTNVVNIVGGSFKHRDLLRRHQDKNLKQLLESGEAHTGQGLHHERRLQRPSDTRWRSHFKTLDKFLVIFSSIVHVLEVIEIEGSTTNETYIPENSKRKCLDVCYSNHLRVEIFCVVIDVQLQELNDRFDVLSSDLLLEMGILNPVNSFSNFDKDRIMTLAKCYPNEFDDGKLRDLSFQLDTFIIHMRGGNFKFSNLQGIHDLAKALVEANLVETYSLVYLLVKLALILPVAMTTMERAFSSMKHIKNEV
ncbi:zinc finger MYM-type protein 1-like [Capsicum annuum]|uniref:zinc finger MYM-type protein 1-like n=1 Tax=Capsicum annuum TaxID=4072 RepID=UPI001FB06705|nr:zinc finger MYM-type protein 1-like [Capsicum annuum]